MDWIDTVATVVQAVAVTAAAIAAIWGLRTWRHEMTARRRAELAEQTLALFFEARDIIAAARFPGGYVGEGSSRESKSSETEDETRYKNDVYAPVERLNRKSEFWGRFDAGRYPFMAVFGEEAATSFQTIREARNRVVISAGMLIKTHGKVNEDREDRKRQRERWENHIGCGLSESDELASQIDDAVLTIEAVCRPAITGATS